VFWIIPFLVDTDRKWMDCDLYTFNNKEDKKFSHINQWIRLKFPSTLEQNMDDLFYHILLHTDENFEDGGVDRRLSENESLAYIGEHEAILNLTLKFEDQVVTGLVFPSNQALKRVKKSS
jgi:hypothetical protein